MLDMLIRSCAADSDWIGSHFLPEEQTGFTDLRVSGLLFADVLLTAFRWCAMISTKVVSANCRASGKSFFFRVTGITDLIHLGCDLAKGLF